MSLKPLIEGKGKTRLTGLVDIVSKGNIYNQSITSMQSLKDQEVSMGKLKVSIICNMNIRKILDEDPAERSAAGTPFSPDVRFSQEVLI